MNLSSFFEGLPNRVQLAVQVGNVYTGIPVRVFRGFSDGGETSFYSYDGLYQVVWAMQCLRLAAHLS